MDRVVAYRIADIELDVLNRALRVAGEDRRVGPKVFELLHRLVQQAGRLVPRAELVQAAWPGRAEVTDTVLARAISRCRKAIDDDRLPEPRIRARWGYGYSFQGEVTAVRLAMAAPPATLPQDATPALTDTDTDTAAGAPTGPRPQAVVLAVLPASAPQDPLHRGRHPAWLHEGLADLLLHTLSEDRRITLLPREVVRELVADATAQPADDQARRIWLRHGSARVLALALGHDGISLHVSPRLLAPDGSQRPLATLYEQEPGRLVQRLAQQVEEALFAAQSIDVPLDLPDSFAVQAYLRAVQAMERQHWQQARRLADVVLDLVPGSLGAALLRLRALARIDVDQAAHLGRRLLKDARQRASDETVATVLTTLARAWTHHPDVERRAQARQLLASALALAKGQPPSDWVIRIHLACAQAAELGEDRRPAAALYQRAEQLALACGNRLRAAFARSNLAYIRCYEGRVDEALCMQTELVHECQALKLPTQAAYAKGMLAEMQRTLGAADAARQTAIAALQSLSQVPADDRAGVAAYLAHASASVALDTGDVALMQLALAQTGADRRQPGPRHQVYHQLAQGRWLFCQDAWPAARALLASAAGTCEAHGLLQMVQIPLVLGLDLAMAAGDAESVTQHIDALGRLPEGWQYGSAGSALVRGQAWQELQQGRGSSARRLLMPLARRPMNTRVDMLARLDAAWLAAEDGDSDTAGRLLQAAGQWPAQSALGGMVDARLAAALGQVQRARALAQKARARWRGPWPAAWAALEQHWAVPGQREGPVQPGSGAAGRLPSEELLRALLLR